MSKPVRGNPKHDVIVDKLVDLMEASLDEETLNNIDLPRLEKLYNANQNQKPKIEKYIRIRKKQQEGGKKGSEIKANMRKKSEQNSLARPYHYKRGY